MKKHAFAALAALAFAIPSFAQTKGVEVKPKGNTETLWKLECSGIGG
ncbi:MAG: hypothetical protein NXI31_20245 [bacterium]|nr:hypothetical protein [bacterium]